MSVDSTVEYRSLEPLGFPGYRVGSDGSVWSLWKKTSYRKTGIASVIGTEWKKMKLMIQDPSGYFIVTLLGKPRRVHRLVLRAFVGEPPPGMECCHEDGNRTNPALSNLRWDTRKNNNADRLRHGTSPRGTNSPNAKLTESEVRAIFAEYSAGGIFLKDLAAKYHVSTPLIGQIVTGRAWKYLDLVTKSDPS